MKWLILLLIPCISFARDPFAWNDNKPAATVLIKARLVSVDRHYLQSLGVIFATQNTQIQTGGGFNMDVPTVETGVGVASIPIANLGNDSSLDLELSALQNEGHATIISSPELLTNDHEAAEISSGEEIPYQEKTGEGNTSVAFKKAVLQLKVTPTILNPKKVILDIEVDQDKISSLSVNGVPAIDTQQIKTLVSVHNTQTIVLGGINEAINTDETLSVPGLGRLPVIGILFHQHQKEVENKTLLIFITPQIMQ